MDDIPDITHPHIEGVWFRTNTSHKIDAVRTWRALAREHKDPLIQLRLEWVLHLRTHPNISEAARHFGISRKALKKWRDRFLRFGIEGLVNQSRAPKHRRNWTLPWHIKERIIDLKREFPVWGKDKLKIEYQKRFEEYISEWQIQRVIQVKNLQWKRPKTYRKSSARQSRPRIQGLKQQQEPIFSLIHADSVELRFGCGTRRYIFTNMEHHSRKGFALVATTKHARHAQELFERTRAEHPSIHHLHTDNGADHRGVLDTGLPAEVTHWVSRPRVPEDNGRLERFHRTMQEECFPSTATLPRLAEMQQRLEAWLMVYNTMRPHQALGNLTPSEYLESLASS